MKELQKIFEKRRSDLIHLLKHHKDMLSPEKQHQIYGAINEIDVILKTIEYKINEQIQKKKHSLIDYKFNNPTLKDKIRYLFK